MIKYPKSTTLGATGVANFPKVQYAKIKEMIDAINSLTTQLEAIETTLALGSGITGTFVSADVPELTITVTDGIITDIA